MYFTSFERTKEFLDDLNSWSPEQGNLFLPYKEEDIFLIVRPECFEYHVSSWSQPFGKDHKIKGEYCVLKEIKDSERPENTKFVLQTIKKASRTIYTRPLLPQPAETGPEELPGYIFVPHPFFAKEFMREGLHRFTQNTGDLERELGQRYAQYFRGEAEKLEERSVSLESH